MGSLSGTDHVLYGWYFPLNSRGARTMSQFTYEHSTNRTDRGRRLFSTHRRTAVCSLYAERFVQYELIPHFNVSQDTPTFPLQPLAADVNKYKTLYMPELLIHVLFVVLDEMLFSYGYINPGSTEKISSARAAFKGGGGYGFKPRPTKLWRRKIIYVLQSVFSTNQFSDRSM